jgi:hypothetical protein
MLGDLLPVSREEMVREIEREIRKRQYVYPRQVAGGKLRQQEADRRIEIMEAIAVELQRDTARRT